MDPDQIVLRESAENVWRKTRDSNAAFLEMLSERLDLFARIVRIVLENAIVKHGSSTFLRQTTGIPQGSPASVFVANLAVYFLSSIAPG